MRERLLIILCFIPFFGAAQKIVKKSWLSSDTTSIYIDAERCYKITLETVAGNALEVEAVLDGEYAKDLVLQLEKQSGTLMITPSFLPSFEDPNDKLSAHKVISIALHIRIPEHRNVVLAGADCNVFASGIFSTLDITLDDGSCTLDRVSESTKVVTNKGSISVSDTAAHIRAKSKYGNVQEHGIPLGDNNYDLSTVSGNIYFSKTE